jgi:hypothetical protein
MISNIFWFFGFIQFISLFGYIFRFRKINQSFEWNYKFKQIVGKTPIKQDFKNKESYNLFTNRVVLSLIEIVWIIFGLITNKWIIFLSILIILLTINFGLDKWRFSIIDNLIRFIFTVIRCLIYISLSIQNFHY